MLRTILTAAILFFVLCQNGRGAAVDSTQATRLELVHADLLQGQKIGGMQVRQLNGNVKFRQGKAILTCERALQYLDEGRTVLSGNVAFVDTVWALYGDQVIYEDGLCTTLVEGSARLVDSSRTLLAARLRYDDRTETAVADGEVVIIDERERSRLSGRYAEYHRATGYARVIGRPMMSRADSTGEGELIIRGVTFELFDDGDRLVVTDSVYVQRGEIEAWCDTLYFIKAENAVKLANAPRVRQNRQRLTGNSVKLLLRDNNITGIEIVGNAIAAALVDSAVTVATPYDLLNGERMMVYVSDDKIDSVRMTGRATSFYHVIEERVEKGLNKVLGDTLFIAFKDDEISLVRVISSPAVSKGEFHPPMMQTALDRELRLLLEKLGIAAELFKESGDAVLTDERTRTEK